MSAHPRDALSALVDGELAPVEEREVRAHVDGCADCRAELAAVTEARAWVRALPAVDPPFPFMVRLSDSGRWRRGMAALTASAAAAVAVLVLAQPQGNRVDPPVPELVQRHAAVSSTTGDPLSELAPAGVPVVFRP